jgi:hypothetical protein
MTSAGGCHSRFRHLSFAAFTAICFRLSAVSLAALAGPPFFPPNRPNATAAGFFSGLGSTSGTTASRTCRAISAGSFCLLERLGIAQSYRGML